MTGPRRAAPPTMNAILHQAPVIPVITLRDLAHAVPLAEALVAGGLPVLEVTLRTPVALKAIELMARVPGVTVGAGTVLSPKDAHAARKAGADFAVSPGSTHHLVDCCEDLGLPLLPGAASATEAMRLFERGFDLLKFFPAEAIGGVPVLCGLAAPLPHIHFCPTGGITPINAPKYLALPNVTCVGGSWLAPEDVMQEEKWGIIRDLANQARHMG